MGEDVINPGLKENLERFYEKAVSDHDKAKCLELLTSLRLGEEIRHQDKISRRPKTAPLPAYGTYYLYAHTLYNYNIYLWYARTNIYLCYLSVRLCLSKHYTIKTRK